MVPAGVLPGFFDFYFLAPIQRLKAKAYGQVGRTYLPGALHCWSYNCVQPGGGTFAGYPLINLQI